MYYIEFEKIIRKIVEKKIEKKLLLEDLIFSFDCNKIYDSDDEMVTDIYFTLMHYASGEENIRKEEWQYFLDCLSGKCKYNIEEKMCITAKNLR